MKNGNGQQRKICLTLRDTPDSRKIKALLESDDLSNWILAIEFNKVTKSFIHLYNMTKHKHKRVYKRTALSLVKRLVQLEFGKDFNARGIFRFLEDVGYYHISSEFILSDIHYYKNTRAAHRSIHGRITNKLRNSIKDENKYPQYKSQLRWMRRHLAAEKAREESLNVKPVRKLLP